jgi:hypothetical protein
MKFDIFLNQNFTRMAGLSFAQNPGAGLLVPAANAQRSIQANPLCALCLCG